MAEFLTNAEARAAAFAKLLSLLTERGAVKDALSRFRPYIDDARPEDLVGAVDAAVDAGLDFKALKPGVSKLINLIYEPLAKSRYLRGGDGGGGSARLFLDALCLENEGLAALLSAGKLRAKALNDAAKAGEELGAEIAGFAAWLEELSAVEAHYRKKENVLFPWFEAAYPRYRCVRLMWEIQDDARAGLKELAGQAARALRSGGLDLARFNAALGRLYFDLNANIIREECALFPVLASLMDEAADRALYAQSLEYGWAFADESEAARLDAAAAKARRRPASAASAEPAKAAGAPRGTGDEAGIPAAAFSGRTGALSHELLAALFAAAPVDMTVVDADDKVAWFTDSPHRIFPRSPAIVGRDVRNCHPGASVGRVVAILEAFKAGRKDSEAFWIEMKGRFISIEYFALRAPDGRYLGTLEVSQDLSGKRALTGEKRLADEV